MDDLNLGVIIAQIINFLVLFFIFKYFLGDKIVQLIKERREHLAELEGVADVVKKKTDDADKEAKKILEAARKKASEIEDSSKALAKKNKKKMLDQAEMEASSIISGARSMVEKERLSMINSMKKTIMDTTLKLSTKLFSKTDVNKDFVEKELENIKL